MYDGDVNSLIKVYLVVIGLNWAEKRGLKISIFNTSQTKLEIAFS